MKSAPFSLTTYLAYCFAVFLFLSSSVQADEDLWLYTKSAVTRPMGSLELKFSDIARIGKNSGDYAFHDIRPEFAYGVTDRLTLGGELVIFDHNYSVDDSELNPMFETQQAAGDVSIKSSMRALDCPLNTMCSALTTDRLGCLLHWVMKNGISIDLMVPTLIKTPL